MNDILTITFNPAIDKSTSITELLPEKKLKCTQPKFEPGGGGINVARAIKRLGGNATALFFSGGYSGQFFNQLLKEEQITILPIDIKGHTRENLIVYDQSSGNQYRFGMPGPFIEKDEWKDLIDELKKTTGFKYIVVSGSLPEGASIDILSQIGKVAAEKDIKFIVDTSGPALAEAIKEKVFLIKPNLNELASLAGMEDIKSENAGITAQELIRTGKCDNIIVSMGPKGALLVTEKEITHFAPPTIKPLSTVGAGDSMVAGIVYSLHQGKEMKESVHFGVACGTAATMNPGTELCHLTDVLSLIEKIAVSENY